VRKLLRCRRGSVAFATAVALVPLIGVVALGAEAGSWYVIKQHAQHAADSAATSGALAIANSDSQTYDYRGKEFGALNGFSSNVTMTRGSYSTGSGFQPGGTPGNGVQAVVTQCQRQSLSSLLYSGSCNGVTGYVTIKTQAVASINTPKKLPCALAEAGSITFQDAAVQVNAPNCALASNVTPSNPVGINFKVAPKTLNVGSLSTSGSCSGSLCGSVSTYAPPVIDPFSALISAMTSPSNLTLPPCPGKTFASIPYATGSCAYNGITINSATPITASGVYFFSGALKLSGNGSLTTNPGVSATIILLPGATLSMTGTSSFNISAPMTAPSASALPSQLGSVANFLTDMAIFDLETSPKIGGTSTMSGSGVFYLPNANPLNYQGNPTSASSTCTEVIAASIQFSGTPNFDNSGCPPNILLKSQLVALVQ
jgi:Flp pilus assembly protein TadG